MGDNDEHMEMSMTILTMAMRRGRRKRMGKRRRKKVIIR